MPDDVSTERVALVAAAARVPLSSDSVARIARAVTPTVSRFVAGPVDMPFENEPATFVVVQHRDAGR